MNKIKSFNRSQAEYVRRINMAFNYIDEHIDQNIQLDDIANSSHFSPFHFHRLFHALVGETVNDYVSRKRMEKAVSRLAYNSSLSITDVSKAGGYSSSANFSKAFKVYFGISPSELRKSAFENIKNDSKLGKLYSKYGKDFNPQDLYSQFETLSGVFDPNKLEDMLMKVKVEELAEKQIAYMTAPKGYDLDSIFTTWDKIVDWARNSGIKCNTQTRFAICHDNPIITPEDKCRYDAAIEINSDINVTQPYVRDVIPSGKYAIAYYKDSADKISHFMTELCSHWFPSSGYEPDNYPPLFNYLNDSRKDGYVEMDVYIKLKSLNIG